MIVTVPYLPFRFDGMALFGCLILIKKGHEKLIPHEQIHIQQQKEHGRFMYHWKWIFNKDFRAMMEIQAYRIGDRLSDYAIAHKLRTIYGIELDPNKHWGVWN